MDYRGLTINSKKPYPFLLNYREGKLNQWASISDTKVWTTTVEEVRTIVTERGKEISNES